MARRFVLTGFAVCCAVMSSGLAQGAAGDWLPDTQSDAAVAVPESDAQIRLSFAPLVQAAAPAVVNIITSVYVGGGPGSRLYDDPFFREFFDDRSQHNSGAPGLRQEPLALGSGVILSPDGIVVTNNHVIDGADSITVVLADQREFEADLVGADPDTDLAVLRINDPSEDLAYLELGDSDQIAVGDLVLAIGNPFGVGQTVTSGIISALARTDIGVSDYAFFIQTDAPINPGNSGGGLITMDGKVIGINTAIYSQSGGSHGIGFAIPANMVRRVVSALIEGGSVIRPWFGVTTQDVTSALATSVGLSRPYGALVVDLVPDGPGAAAGLQVGDVLLSIDGHELENSEAAHFRIGTYAPGDTITLMVMRDGAQMEVTATLAPPPSSRLDEMSVALTGRHPLAGSSVAPLTPDLMDEYDLGQMRGGALVTAVEDNSPAARIGLAVGDVIVGVNGREIITVDNLTEILNQPQPLWRISVVRDGSLLSVTVRG